MKKKFLTLIIAMATMLMCIFGLSACGKVEFKVNFVVDGAVYSTLNTNGEEIIKMPENPTKEDYTFDGWYWDKDTWQTPFTANSLLDAPLSSDMNVYCKWRPNTVNVESITLNKTEIILHENGEEYLTATILPENATDTSVVWKSSNSTIATVVGGKVTALRVGNATITATTTDGGKVAMCTVYVEPIHVESVFLNYTSLTMNNGESKTLTATVLPNDATDKGVLWHSSNSSVAMVENGVVEAVGYGTATITVTTIDGDKTATCDIEIIEDRITFATLSVDGETVYGKVSNDTTTFSFIREITEHGNATYQMYKEITCETLIASKSISLNPGDNTVYVLQTVGRDLTLYTVTVRRRPMYNVTFDSNGGTAVEKQVIEEDYCATEPISPTRAGYTFAGWDYDFSQPITQNTTMKANWTANTNTPYKVEYHLQNLENDDYTLEMTENKTGTTDTTANAEIKTFAHFTHAPSATDSGNIAPDGSAVLKVYYTRDKYTVTFDGNGGTLVNGVDSQIIKYSGEATAPTYEREGYTFDGYDKAFTNISEDTIVTAKWTINQYTLTIVYGNGQEDKVVTQDYNTPIETIAVPEQRAGYDFDCWDAMPETMPAENVTVTARWKAIYMLSGGTITGLTDYGKTNYTALDIPSVIDGVDITSIGYRAFYNDSILTSVEIPDSMESIGEGAFCGCSALTEIIIPDSVTSIGVRVFYGCSGLTEITLPFVGASKDATGYQSVFGYIFGYTTRSNSSAVSGATYQYYNSDTYYHYYISSSLKKVTITGGQINSDAFYNCSSLTSVVIGDSVTRIGYEAFCACSGLTEIIIPNSVTSIGNYAFYDCDGLMSVEIGDCVTSIGDYAFRTCSGLTEIIIPNSVTSIGNYAFYDCDGLMSVVIGDSVESIGYEAFYNCSSLTSVKVPNSVTSIGNSAFRGCSALTEITLPFVGASKDATWYQSVFGYIFGYTTRSSSSTISGATYQYNKGNKYYHYYIPTSLKKVTITGGQINSDAFYNCSSLTSVVIGDSVESIGYEAFYNCSSLTSVEIGDSVKMICTSAFSSCYRLTEIIIPDSVTSIHYSAFKGCTSLTYNTYGNCKYLGSKDNPYYALIETVYDDYSSYTIHEDTKIIVGSAFWGCSDMGRIVIPDSVTSIGGSAFYDCDSLTSVEIGDSVTSIGNYAFKDCDCLTEIIIPDSVTSIGYEAFYDCDCLTSVEIGDSVTSIGNYAFKDCDSLTEIIIPDSVTSIGDSAFSSCGSLTYNTYGNCKYLGSKDNPYYALIGTVNCDYNSYTINEDTKIIVGSAFWGCSDMGRIVIPDSVTSIGEYAFRDCFSLTSVEIGDSVTSIGNYAFKDCDCLTEIIIPDSVESIGYEAFYDCDSLTEIIIPDSVIIIDCCAFFGCDQLTIFCESDSKLEGWDDYWNCCFRVWSDTSQKFINVSYLSVVWGYVDTN